MLGQGWDNTVHLVGDQWVFRFPRREQAVDGVRREIAVLPWLGPQLPLPIPVPELIGSENGWPFWGGRLVPGTEMVGLPEAGRATVAVAVGRFLRALHDTDPPAVLRAALPTDPMQRANPAVRGTVTRRWLAELDRADLPDLESLLDEAAGLGDPTGHPRLTHGDLHVRHLMVEGGGASGVIDWGDVCLADPSVDLSLAFSAFAGDARQALLAAYGAVSTETALRARVLGASLCAALAAYALSEGNAPLLDETLQGLARCIAD
jgi:aminoglycoside phosphotransferase (APT) family kinase protein